VILVEIAFDFLDQRLLITTSDGQQRVVELGRRPACADFYRDVFGALHAVGVDVEIHAEPFDLGDSPPVRRGHDQRQLRRRRGHPLLAHPHPNRARPSEARLAFQRQGQPDPALLASFDHGGREPTSQTSIACWCSPAQR
jgi:hypothetical protein